MSWDLIDPAVLTSEDRKIMQELIEEERRERESKFWDSVDRNGWYEEVQSWDGCEA